MRYRAAMKLHRDDEVAVKKSGAVFKIIDVTVDIRNKEIHVKAPDGTWWRHTDIK